MGRLLIFLVLGLVVAWWIFHRIGRLRGGPKPPGDRPKTTSGAQDMVACAHCGLLVPQDEAVRHGELHYCGEPHRLLGPRP